MRAFQAVTLHYDVEVRDAQAGERFFDSDGKGWESVGGDVSKDEADQYPALVWRYSRHSHWLWATV